MIFHCPSVLWHCRLGHLTHEIVPKMTYNVSSGLLFLVFVVILYDSFIMLPTVGIGKRAISVAFIYQSVCPSVAYTANNSRTRRPSMPIFGMKVRHLRCNVHTSFKVKWSKVGVTDGQEHTVSAEPGGHSACYVL